MKKQTQNGLIGKFFHSLDKEGKVEWQGMVISNPEPGWYLLQLFEWAMGEPNLQKLVRIEDMKNWLIYQDEKMMEFSYDHGVARAGGPYRKQFKMPS